MRTAIFLPIYWFLTSLPILGQWDAPDNFYDSANGLTGDPLKAALHELIDDHTIIPYSSSSTDTRDALVEMYEDPQNTNNIILVYSGISIPKANTSQWNREHLWPQSYGVDSEPGRSDLFNLQPSDIDVNSARGNRIYDDVQNGVFHAEAPESQFDSFAWEPRNEEKGDIARSMFYMAVRYEGGEFTPDLELSDTPNESNGLFGSLVTLLEWHELDPVSDIERERNHLIFTSYQDNRNPFIDHPEWVEMIWGIAETLTLTITPAEFSESAGNNAAEVTIRRSNHSGILNVSLSLNDYSEANIQQAVSFKDTEDSVSVWLAAVDDSIEDGDQLVTLTATANGTPTTNHTFTVKDTDEESNQPVTSSDLFISEYIEGSSLNKAVEIYNGTGAIVDLSKYNLELYTNGSTSASQSLQLSGNIDHGEVYVIANSGANSQILAQTDTTHGVASFNGDDVVALSHDGTIIDLIGGPVGQRSEWAKDITLIRNPDIMSGSVIFDVGEWTSLDKDNSENLGSHTIDSMDSENPTETPTSFTPQSWAYWETYPWIFNNGTWYYMLAVDSLIYIYNYDTKEWLPMGN